MRCSGSRTSRNPHTPTPLPAGDFSVVKVPAGRLCSVSRGALSWESGVRCYLGNSTWDSPRRCESGEGSKGFPSLAPSGKTQLWVCTVALPAGVA